MPLLDQDVQNDAVLVNRSPQLVTYATEFQRHLVQMPLVDDARVVDAALPQMWLKTSSTTVEWPYG